MKYLIFVLALAGCAERQAQVSVQNALNVMAEGVSSVDEIVSREIPDRASAARSQVLSEEYTDVEVGMARYMALMRDWYELTDALEIAHESLRIGQGALDVWVNSGDLPEEWGEFCGGIGDALQAIVRLLGECGINVPESIEGAVPWASSVCEIAGRYFSGT